MSSCGSHRAHATHSMSEIGLILMGWTAFGVILDLISEMLLLALVKIM